MISTPVLDTVILDDDQQEGIDPFQARTGLVIFPDRVTVASAREVSRILRSDIVEATRWWSSTCPAPSTWTTQRQWPSGGSSGSQWRGVPGH